MDVDTHPNDGQGLAVELQLPGPPRSATESTAFPHTDLSASYKFPGGCATGFGLLVGG